MPYPENFVVRLIICIVGMLAIWMAARYVAVTFIRQEAFSIDAFDIVVPMVIGVVEAFVWKPKEKK